MSGWFASGFWRLLAARVTSQIADGWFQAGLAGSLLFNPERRASPMAIATGFAVLLLPYSLVGPYVGVLLDRWQRRTALSTANLLRAGLVVPCALLLASGTSNGLFALCALLVIAVNRFVLAGVGAALPHVVEDKQLVAGNALATTLGTVAYALGLGSSAVLLGVSGVDNHGYALIALLGAGGYLLSAAMLWALFSRTALGPDDLARRTDTLLLALILQARGMVAGLRHLVQRPVAGYALVVQGLHRLLYGVLALATLLLFSHADGGMSGLGLVIAAGGLGTLAAAVITPPATRRLPGWAWISVLLGTTGPVLLVTVPPFRAPLLLTGTFLLNIASQGTKIVVDTALQHECDDAFRGRVFSVNDTAFNATFVLGLLLAAGVLPDDGRSVPAVVLVALGYAGLAGWYAVVGRRAATRSSVEPVRSGRSRVQVPAASGRPADDRQART
jgi:MFS family permease